MVLIKAAPTISAVPKSAGPRPVHEPVREHPRPCVRPHYRPVEVRFSDRSWRPAEILAWHKLSRPEKSVMSGWKAHRLVLLRYPDGTRTWHLLTDSGAIRPRS